MSDETTPPTYPNQPQGEPAPGAQEPGTGDEAGLPALQGSRETASLPQATSARSPAVPAAPEKKGGIRAKLVVDLILILVLLSGAYLRLVGIYWGEWQYLHPDERFLVWVGSDISPKTCSQPDVSLGACPPEQVRWMGFSEYFDTVRSGLNPHNRGHSFYVYGTLPMFLTRYVVDLIFDHSGFQEMTQVGRPLSAAFDLLAVLLVFLVAERLYNRRAALLAAAFAAASVLPIQQAHFFTMDTFVSFFSMLAFYFAVRVALGEDGNGNDPHPTRWREVLRHAPFRLSLGFGLALGMAVASKINAAPIAVILPAAFFVRLVDTPKGQRERRAIGYFGYLVLAAFASLVIFRLLQPYAFSGPGVLGITPNPNWIDDLRELAAQSGGDVDFPPAMQWARRPIWYSFQHLVQWGLGLPLGLLAWAGFIWAGWRMLVSARQPRGEWRKHILPWTWTALYFGWQSLALNPTMRYQLPIYPMLAIFAGWALVSLWDKGKALRGKVSNTAGPGAITWLGKGWIWKASALLVGVVVLTWTYAYAYGFTRIYVRPITRVEATRWIYQNIPGPLNLQISTDSGVYNQPLPYVYGSEITPGSGYQTSFRAKRSGVLTEVYLPHILDLSIAQPHTLELTLSQNPGGQGVLTRASLTGVFDASSHPRGGPGRLVLDPPVPVSAENTYYLSLNLAGSASTPELRGEVSLRLQTTNRELVEQALPSGISLTGSTSPVDFSLAQDGLLTHVILRSNLPLAEYLIIHGIILTADIVGEELHTNHYPVQVMETGTNEYLLSLEEPVAVSLGILYRLSLDLQTLGGKLVLSGDGVASEGDWDDNLPLRMDGYDGYGGLYPLDLTFNMYWDDSADKLARFTRILDQADWITMSSNRQWGTLPRIPERFPMTTLYYRELLGCPVEKDVVWCYMVAEPGMFQGRLGFDLVETFTSYPGVGSVELNDQFADEAFSVYDHPKVMIFKKTSAYTPQFVQAVLGSVDFSQVIRIAPMRAPDHPLNLMLPMERWLAQQAGGTWKALFDRESWINRWQPLTVIAWYLAITLLGVLAYPLLRLALPGLADRGYPLARMAGLLLFSWLVWLGGSLAPSVLPFTRPTMFLVLILFGLLSGLAVYYQRDALRHAWRSERKYYLMVEGLFLAFFIFALLIRAGNPDLWHPWKGGEKPMDFAYLNAVLKSTSFPPYDPWYAGGYLNYYYYGFVLFGVPVKLLGIVPAVAYNLILPTVFSLIALGAYSIAWNLASSRNNNSTSQDPPSPEDPIKQAGVPAIAAALGMAVLGNLGTVRMIVQGYQRLAAPDGVITGASLLQRWAWTFEGVIKVIEGARLPYGIGDWYWIPSRAIPPLGDIEPITEFPFFTFLYGDPHAHFFALPITLLALSYALAVVLGRGRWQSAIGAAAGLLFGGLAIGALRPTNTWDYYPYLALALVCTAYALAAYFELPAWLRTRLRAGKFQSLEQIPDWVLSTGAALVGVALLAGLTSVLFQPYTAWYGLGYDKVEAWMGPRTPLSAYLTHWGLFLFIIVSWMTWETRDWLDKTPVSALRKLQPHLPWIILAAGLVLSITLALGIKLPPPTQPVQVQPGILGILQSLPGKGVWVSFLALPLAAWAGVLILRPNQVDSKRFVLFLVGTGLILTLMVELVRLAGDIGRMNTVFKFYLQVWTLFAISAAAALGWLLADLGAWLPLYRRPWQVVMVLLLGAALMYPMLGGIAKIEDRMSVNAPRGLDGMAYMASASYGDEYGVMDLNQDYHAIRWMQENVAGSPVIVEANLRNLYHWGSRFSIYTGLPGVVGWEWHQQQQRALVPGTWITNRILEVDNFYTTLDMGIAQNFLSKYRVAYIILGQQELLKYPGEGLDKFEAGNGVFWDEVYRSANTVIYQVRQP